ncbi:MAG: precorrin-4 C(11)-methyltransferase [Breznakibacter sp.]
MHTHAIITFSDAGAKLANKLLANGFGADLAVSPNATDTGKLFDQYDALVYIGALGICVRHIAPLLQHKAHDPAVVNIDVHGRFVQSVTGGHAGGANQLALALSRLLGATPVITTVSDTSHLWALDLLPRQFGWKMECTGRLTSLMAAFVNERPTALVLEARDAGTLFLEHHAPAHVTVYHDPVNLVTDRYEVIICVTPYVRDFGRHAIFFRPAMLHVGTGCQKGIDGDALHEALEHTLRQQGFSPLALASLGTATIKKDEPALQLLSQKTGVPLIPVDHQTLAGYDTPSPSAKVEAVTGSASVAEAAAMHLSGNTLAMTKEKLRIGDKYATFAVAADRAMERKGFVEIVGAGPGDPLLVTVRGKMLLQCADLILYAGSLVPIELTHYAKPGCTVRNSAPMDLQQQIGEMKTFTDRGLLVVRLHTGDPCIYGAIQEQMAELDKLGIPYRITPGVSSFQAAAAALRSQFTIPEEVQTIILTRGEGRTSMPEREQLHKLAQSQSTMCIFLSATLARQVQEQLMAHYPPHTPVAICHKLTWKEEQIWHCPLHELAQTVDAHHLTATTLIVVGKAIGNRSGNSKLYDAKFNHLFRP